MIYLLTASYCEASAWIVHYRLKKDTGQTRFQVFENQDAGIRLVITGEGGIAAAVAIGSIGTQYRAGAADFLIHIGFCDNTLPGKTPASALFLCNQILEQETGNVYYPDILYRHPFQEASVCSGITLPSQSRCEEPIRRIYDTQAAAIYQAGSYFFGPHQMIFLKATPKSGQTAVDTPEEIKSLIGLHTQPVAAYIARLKAAGQKEERQEPVSGDLLETLCRDLYCTKAMSLSLEQHIRYCMLAGIDYRNRIDGLYREQKLPCKNKREGKRCFEELKQKLL